MKQPNGREGFGRLSVATITMGRSLLLVSSGVVRSCDKETMLQKLRRQIARWGLSKQD